MSGRRNIQRERCIHHRETVKKERLDENVETQNKMKKMKKHTMGEKKYNEGMEIERKLRQTGVVMLMRLRF
jgi:hypothetical protein